MALAVYKVIQDIEAEDKILGPLGLKQLIYAIIAAACGFICFRLFTLTELGAVRWGVIIIFLMPVIVFGVLAAPLGGNQPTETWLLAKLRFMLKPQMRIWDQSGMKELVTITAPKKIIRQYTDGLSQSEVKSRLNALATTLDSRGWAVKNVNVNMFSHPGYFEDDEQSDRLITTENLPQDVPAVDVRPEDDILDPQSNATAHHLDRLMQEVSTKSKLEALEKFNSSRRHDKPESQPTPPPDFWFMHQKEKPVSADPNEVMFTAPITARPGEEPDQTLSAAASAIEISQEQERQLLDNIEKTKGRRKLGQGRLPTLNPSNPKKSQKPAAKKLTPERETAIISLANNDDISVATIAKEAKRQSGPEPLAKQNNDGEVVVRLR